MENIKISVSESGRDTDLSVVRIDGVIDTLTATQLEEVLERLLKRGQYKIILDLAGVDYISSAGWGIFISRIKEIREKNGDIKLANMVANVYEIYELLEFDNILSSYDSVVTARSDFEGSLEQNPLKKKAPVGGVTTVVEDIPTIASVMSPAGGQKARLDKANIAVSVNTESIILDAIRQDPFYTIAELKVVVEETIPHSGISWWKVLGILKKNGLVLRKSRFRFARRSWKRFG